MKPSLPRIVAVSAWISLALALLVVLPGMAAPSNQVTGTPFFTLPPTAAESATPSSTFTYTPIPSTPSITPTGTLPTMTPSATVTRSVTATRTFTRTPTRTSTPTATSIVTSTETPTDTPTALPTETPTVPLPITFEVNSTADRVDAIPGNGLCAASTGECTLRAAVMEANALVGDQVIQLPNGVFSLTITGLFEEASAAGDLDVLGTLTIVGQGMTMTGIDATGLGDRVLHVHPDANFTLRGVNVSGADIGSGANGAGLRNDYGDVLVEESAFQGNRAHNGAGLMNVGTMEIRHSLIFGNTASAASAGIRNDTQLVIDSSTIANNEVTSGPGGGIVNHGPLIIRNSTISGNRATNRAAAIYNGYDLVGTESSLLISNSTIFANQLLPDETEFEDTGGILNESTSSAEIRNTILAGNAVDFEYSNCVGTIGSAGYNLLGNLTGCLLDGDLTGNVLLSNDDPGLGPLTGHSDHTGSHPPQQGSPAINAGNPATPGSTPQACEVLDQHRIPRPIGPVCDIGSYESEYGGPGFPTWTPSPTGTVTPPTATSTRTATSTLTPTLIGTPDGVFHVSSLEDLVDSAPGNGICASATGACTLRAAIMESNALPGPDTIVLNWATYPLSLQGTDEDLAATGDLDIRDDLFLSGAGMNLTLIEGVGLSDRAIHVHPGVWFEMDRVSVFSANPGIGQNGGGLLNESGTVLLSETSFQYNTADDGAGLLNRGTMYVGRSLLWANTAAGTGAGIRNEGSLRLDQSTLGQNQAALGGGAIANAGDVLILNSTISSNYALNGPAVLLNEADASTTFNNTTIYANQALPGGTAPTGGITNQTGGSVFLSNTILAANANETGYANCLGEIVSFGYNLVGSPAGCSLMAAPSDLVGIEDPKLGMLMENPDGTGSHPLLPGSPAIDAGNPAPAGSDLGTCETIDQRGVIRPQGPACDIGAYESGGTVGTPTNTPTPSITPTPTPIVPRMWDGTVDNLRAMFGFSVSGAGDVNADGYDDVLIGAREYAVGEPYEGGAFLYYGAASGPSTSPVWSVEANQAYAAMGGAVAGAGDVNGDGFADILVAAYQYAAGQPSEGAAFAYYGSPAGPSESASWSSEGNLTGAYYGWAIAGAGDVNGDGFDDAVIGARYFNNGQQDEGKAYVYLGSPTGLASSPGWTLEGNISDAGFGYAVSGAGDVNGDGYDDVLIGSYNFIRGVLNGGKAYLFLGSPAGLAPSPDWVGESGMPMDGYGHSVAGAGDVNLDGYDDILVGAPAGESTLVGKAYLYLGSSDGPADTPAWQTAVGNPGTGYGRSLAGDCDVDTDGYADFAVGASGYSGPTGVYLYRGGPSGPGTSPLWWVRGSVSGAFGHAVGRAGQVDGDRYCDVLIGAPMSGNGHAYVAFGLSPDPSVPTVTPSPIPPPTLTRTPSASPTDTATPTDTPTPTPTDTPTPRALFADGFESGDLSAWSSAVTDQVDLRVTSAAAIGGAYGLQAVLDDNRSLYVVDDTPSAETSYRARFYFDPNGIQMASGNSHILLLARDAAGRVVFRLEFRSFQGDYQVRAAAPFDSAPTYVTSWTRLPDSPHFLEVAWWAASGEDYWGGALHLLVDGEFVAGEDGFGPDTRRVDSVRLGAVSGVDAGTRGTYYFDSFASTQSVAIGPDPSIILPTPTPPPDAIFADGFETGDLTAWSAVKNDVDLPVSPAAALDGALGLEAIFDDTLPRYVTDWSPVAEQEYSAHFRFDPNSLAMLDGRSHIIFQGLMGSSQPVLRMELRSKTGAYQIRAGALYENGWQNTLWWEISDEPHDLELEWRSSIGNPSGGVIALSIDGAELQLDSVPSIWFQIDFVRLGAVAGVDAGTLGSMYFDAFESHRQSHIGLPFGQ